MHTVNKRQYDSDDEELELLRLEALKSIKKPTVLNNGSSIVDGSSIFADPILEPVAPILCSKPTFNGGVKCGNKRGRYHGNGRVPRNGTYNRVRNYNLISVPTIESDSVSENARNSKFLDKSVPKLILPQDRYCGLKTEEKVSDCGSKFDRYNDSEESGTDSESELGNASEVESPKKLERSNSLEALLQELENEIQGVSTKPTEVTKPPEVAKPRIKVKKFKTEKLNMVINETPKEEILETEVNGEEKHDCNTIIEEKKNYVDKKLPLILNKPDSSIDCKTNFGINSSFIPISNQNSVIENNLLHPLPYINVPISVVPTVPPYVPPVYSQFSGSTIYSNSLPYPFPNLPPVVEPARIRPLSPLAINTDILNTITAPLSPRSAAFVLQNREIIERRKKSPRRSYSRSPSPEYRGSLSPRYRRSPKRSPKHSPNSRVSPIRNIAKRYSPKLKSNSRHCSPKHITSSPHRHNKHPRSEVSNKSENENKLNSQDKNVSICKSPSPKCISRTNSPVDAILEARRRKFETSNAIATEGVIRLKPKAVEDLIGDKKGEDSGGNEANEEMEDLLLDTDEFDLGISVTSNDIFSDEEESDGDNEGRFKTRQQEVNHVSMVPFTQLLNETSSMIRQENLNGTKSSYSENKDRCHSYFSTELEKQKTSNPLTTNSERKSLKRNLRLHIQSKGQRRKPPIVSPIENKKIEIRIRNPSKYESNSNSKHDIADNIRKVEVSNLPSSSEDSDKEIKILDENVDDSKNEGDLRTQLSRKRAGRQNKLPTTDGVQSRLLQNALQGAIYKRTLKSNKEKEVAPLDGKLPIHLRLGIPGSQDIFSEVSVQKTPKKRSKIRGNLDQV